MDFYTAIHKHYNHIFPLQKAQVEFVRNSISEISRKLLDVGCATGSLAIELSKYEYEVYGIDLDPAMIETALLRNSSEKGRAIFQQGNMLRLRDVYDKELFDGVICFGNTLVHLDSLEEVQSFLNLSR
jgi:glycine/sarcosine N-methyltransferase